MPSLVGALHPSKSCCPPLVFWTEYFCTYSYFSFSPPSPKQILTFLEVCALRSIRPTGIKRKLPTLLRGGKSPIVRPHRQVRKTKPLYSRMRSLYPYSRRCQKTADPKTTSTAAIITSHVHLHVHPPVENNDILYHLQLDESSMPVVKVLVRTLVEIEKKMKMKCPIIVQQNIVIRRPLAPLVLRLT